MKVEKKVCNKKICVFIIFTMIRNMLYITIKNMYNVPPFMFVFCRFLIGSKFGRTTYHNACLVRKRKILTVVFLT